MVKRALGILLALASLALFARLAEAQTTGGSLAGTVRDTKGAPVAAATVQARSDATGVVRTATTDAGGRFRIDLLAPGVWIVAARGGEGATSESRTVTIRLQQTIRTELTLGAGLTETVTVSGEAPLVDPHRIASQVKIGAAEVDAIPLSGRQITDLALLDSTILATPPGNYYGERGSVFVVNGQSGRANSFLVDGMDNNDQASGTNLNSFFSQQVIREYVVLSRQYSAEFGRASGGVLNIVTDHGGNTLTAEEFLQGSGSQWGSPGEFVTSLPQPQGLQDVSSSLSNGFKVGGPIVKDRAFFFLAYEHQQDDQVTPYTGVTRDGVGGGWMIAPQRDNNFFLRTDFNLSSSNFLMLRLSSDQRSTYGLNVGGVTTPEAGFHLFERDLQFGGSLTSIVSPSLVNEARLLVSRSGFDQHANSDRPGVERPSGIFGGNNLNKQIRDEDLVQLVDNLSWTAGNHSPKVGIDLLHSKTTVDARFNPNGNFLYQTDKPFEPGDCGDLTIEMLHIDPKTGKVDPWYPIPCPGRVGVDDDGDGTIDEPGYIGTYPLVFELIEGHPKTVLNDTRIAVFAQDSWQMGPKLLVDYGLRYDLSTYTLPGSASVPSRIPNGGAGTDRDNLAPRLGFAWTPTSDGKLVVRGGAGIFYDKLVLGFPAVAAITSGTQIGLLFPQGLTFEITEKVIEQYGINAIKPGLIFPQSLVLRFSTGTTLDTPYTVQYGLGVERSIGEHASWHANLVRALGYHAALMKDLNPVVSTSPEGIPVHRDANFGSIAAVVTEGRSWYAGLDLGWQWRQGRTWYSFSYTLSKALDLGADPLKGGISIPPNSDCIDCEKARSDSDRRHRFVLAGETALPWFGLRASGVVQVASGAPFNVTTGRDENTDGLTNDRPPGVGRNTGEETPLGPVNALRRDAGLPPVHSLNEPSFTQIDVRVFRAFPLGAKWSGELFAQVFNVLNRFNAGPIEGRVTSKEFGKPIGQVGPPRTVELGMKIGF